MLLPESKMRIRNPHRYQQKQYAGVVVVQQASHNYTDSMHKQPYTSQAVGVHEAAQRAEGLSIKTSLPGKGKETSRLFAVPVQNFKKSFKIHLCQTGCAVCSQITVPCIYSRLATPQRANTPAVYLPYSRCLRHVLWELAARM